jgi:hypothetical protein
MPPRALLMMNNDFDTDQPKHYAIDCYRELRSSYATQPERLRLNIYPAGHTVTPQMERDAVEWFVTHSGERNHMAVNYKAELVGVLGYPVAENPTCVMQEAAFAALGLNWRYLTMEVKPENLADAMRGVRALGMKGINLTIPHKVAVMSLLDEIAPDAKVIGAVNTVYREGDRLIGANTDGKGFLRGLRTKQTIRRGRVWPCWVQAAQRVPSRSNLLLRARAN